MIPDTLSDKMVHCGKFKMTHVTIWISFLKALFLKHWKHVCNLQTVILLKVYIRLPLKDFKFLKFTAVDNTVTFPELGSIPHDIASFPPTSIDPSGSLWNEPRRLSAVKGVAYSQ